MQNEVYRTLDRPDNSDITGLPLTPENPGPSVPLVISPPPDFGSADDYGLALKAPFAADIETMAKATKYNINMEYKFDTEPDPTNPFFISSYVLNVYQRIEYTNLTQEDLTAVHFRFLGDLAPSCLRYTIHKVLLDGRALDKDVEVSNSILIIPVKQAIKAGDSIKIDIVYSIFLPYSGWSTYNSYGLTDYGVSLPSTFFTVIPFGSGGWSDDFPNTLGDNVFSEASLYSVSIKAPKSLEVVSSGSLAYVQDTEQETKTWHLVGAPVRDFSIFLLKYYQKITKDVDGTSLNIYTLQNSNESDKALDIAERSFEFYQDKFGPYPYRELDIIETDTSAGGKEYPGLFVLNRLCFTYDNPYLEHYLVSCKLHSA